MDRNVRVVLETIICSKTTEAGEDEVYIPTAHYFSDGARRDSFVAPGSNSHWNVNDSGSAAWQNVNFTLLNSKLPDGAQIDTNCLIMERDGGSAKQAIDVAAGIAVVLGAGNPTVVAGAGIAKLIGGILPGDTDDWIGGFAVSLTNKGGDVEVNWTKGTRSAIVLRAQLQKEINSIVVGPEAAFIRQILGRLLPRSGTSRRDRICHLRSNGDGSSYITLLRVDIT